MTNNGMYIIGILESLRKISQCVKVIKQGAH